MPDIVSITVLYKKSSNQEALILSTRHSLAVIGILSIFLWVFLGGSGHAHAAPGGSVSSLSQEQRRQVKRAAERAYQNAPKVEGRTIPRARALSAGETAGRMAADLGASPADVGSIVAEEMRSRGGDPRDSVAAAVSGIRGAGGSLTDVAKAAGSAARERVDELNQAVKFGPNSFNRSSGNRAGIASERDELVSRVISEVGDVARAESATPAQLGQALSAALQGVPKELAAYLVIQYLKGSGGNGLSILQQGLVHGHFLLGMGYSAYAASNGARAHVHVLGGTRGEEDAVKIAIFTSGEEKPKKDPVPEPQSRRRETGEGPSLAGIGRVMGGLGGEGRSAVRLPAGGDSSDPEALASARGSARSGYRVVPRNQPGRGGTPTAGAQQTVQAESATESQPSDGRKVASAQGSVNATTSVGFLGQWGLQKGDCGIDSLQFTGSEQNPVLNVGGQSVPVSVRDNVAIAEKITLKEFANSRLTITNRNGQLQAVGGLANGRGSVCTMVLTRVNF